MNKQKMIAQALKAGNKKLACKLALLAEVQESGYVILADAHRWVAHEVSKNEWAGYTSALQAEGFYVALHDADYKGWGEIK